MGVERAVPEEVVESVGEGAEVKVGLGVTLVEVLTEAATVRVIAAESVPVPRGDRDKEGDPESLRDTEGVALWESDSVGLTVTLRREESADRVGRAVAEPQFVTEGEGEAEGEPEEEPLAVAVSSAVPVRLPVLQPESENTALLENWEEWLAKPVLLPEVVPPPKERVAPTAGLPEARALALEQPVGDCVAEGDPVPLRVGLGGAEGVAEELRRGEPDAEGDPESEGESAFVGVLPGPGLKLAVELRSRGVPVPKLLLGVAKEVIVLEAEGVCSADALSPPGRLPVAEGELLHDPPPIAAEGEDETVPHLVTVPLDVVVAVCIEEAEEVPARRDSVDCDVEL